MPDGSQHEDHVGLCRRVAVTYRLLGGAEASGSCLQTPEQPYNTKPEQREQSRQSRENTTLNNTRRGRERGEWDRSAGADRKQTVRGPLQTRSRQPGPARPSGIRAHVTQGPAVRWARATAGA